MKSSRGLTNGGRFTFITKTNFGCWVLSVLWTWLMLFGRLVKVYSGLSPKSLFKNSHKDNSLPCHTQINGIFFFKFICF